MHRHYDAQERVNRLQLLRYKTERNVIKTGAAVLLGNANAEQIQLRHLAQHSRVEVLLLVPLLDEGRHFLLRKLPHGLYQCLVIFRQFKIDHLLTLFNSVLKMTAHLTQVETAMSKHPLLYSRHAEKKPG